MPQNISNFQTQRNRIVGQGLERATTWLVILGANLVKIVIDTITYMVKMLMGKY